MESEVVKLVVLDDFKLKSRGTVYTGKYSDNPGLTYEILKEMSTAKEIIEINGNLFTIKGIETFAVPDFMKTVTDSFGVLVAPHITSI